MPHYTLANHINEFLGEVKFLEDVIFRKRYNFLEKMSLLYITDAYFLSYSFFFFFKVEEKKCIRENKFDGTHSDAICFV